MSSAFPAATPRDASIRHTEPTRSRAASLCASAPPSSPAPTIAILAMPTVL